MEGHGIEPLRPSEGERSRYQPRPRPFLSVSVGIWILAALCVIGFVQAILLFPRLFGWVSRDASSVAGLNPTERDVSFLLSRGQPPLVLKGTLDHPAAATLDAALLDRCLFPGGDRHRWYVLQTVGPAGNALSLDLVTDPLVLHLSGGEQVSPVVLGADHVFAQEELPPYLRMQLRSLRFGEARVDLDPANCPRILLAFPESAEQDQVVGAKMGGRDFEVVRVSKDEFDTELEGRGEFSKARRP